MVVQSAYLIFKTFSISFYQIWNQKIVSLLLVGRRWPNGLKHKPMDHSLPHCLSSSLTMVDRSARTFSIQLHEVWFLWQHWFLRHPRTDHLDCSKRIFTGSYTTPIRLESITNGNDNKVQLRNVCYNLKVINAQYHNRHC